MGVNLRNFVTKESMSLESLQGKTIGIDASSFMYRYLYTFKDKEGNPLKNKKGFQIGYILGFMSLFRFFYKQRITCIVVFEGKNPKIKKETAIKRKEAEEKLKEKYEFLQKKGDYEAAKKVKKNILEHGSFEIKQVKNLCSLSGIQGIQAQEEADWVLVNLYKAKKIHAVFSRDYDYLIYGVNSLFFPEKNEYLKVSFKEKFSKKELLFFPFFLGCDYFEGIKGIGPKTVLNKTKELKSFKDFLVKYNIPQKKIKLLEEAYSKFKDTMHNYKQPIWLPSKLDFSGLKEFFEYFLFSEEKFKAYFSCFENA